MKLLIVSFFFVFSIFANELKDINSFEATFKQSIINNSQKEITYTGKIYIKKPFQIVWIYNDPIEKYVYIHNKNLSIIEPDLEQIILSKLEQEFNILELLDNATKIAPSKYLATINNTKYTLTIQNKELKQIRYKDTIDNSVNIKFENIKQNHSIDPTIFKYDIPKEYDIIRK